MLCDRLVDYIANITESIIPLWRLLYIIHLITEKTPSSITFFISTLLVNLGTMVKLYEKFAANPEYSKFINLQTESKKSYDMKCIMMCREIDMRNWEFPPLPSLHQSGFIASIMFLIKTISKHKAHLFADHKSCYIDNLCHFLQVTHQVQFLTYILSTIREWVEGEDDIVNLQDLTTILTNTKSVYSLPMTTVTIGYIEEFWNLVYIIQKCYVVLSSWNKV